MSDFIAAVDRVRAEIKRRGWVYEWRQVKDADIAFFFCTFGAHQFYIQIVLHPKGGAYTEDHIWYSFIFSPRHEFMLWVNEADMFANIERSLAGELVTFPRDNDVAIAKFMERFGAAELKGWGAYVEG